MKVSIRRWPGHAWVGLLPGKTDGTLHVGIFPTIVVSFTRTPRPMPPIPAGVYGADDLAWTAYLVEKRRRYQSRLVFGTDDGPICLHGPDPALRPYNDPHGWV